MRPQAYLSMGYMVISIEATAGHTTENENENTYLSNEKTYLIFNLRELLRYYNVTWGNALSTACGKLGFH